MAANNLHAALLQKFPIISDQITEVELKVVLRELEKVLATGQEGAVVEFGCFSGTTSLFIRRLLDGYQDNREFHVYDSFEGLPPKSPFDQNAAGVDFKAGELMVSKKQFLKNFERAKLRPPIMHKGWFSELPPTAIPGEIAFAFLDGDFYDSILQSLSLVWPSRTENAVVLVHDYKRETLPGVAKAIDDYFGQNKHKIHITAEANIAIIRS